jgi:hypothetical protein
LTEAEYSLVEFNLNHKTNIEHLNATLADLAVMFENGSFSVATPDTEQFDCGLSYNFHYRGYQIRILFEYNPSGNCYATISRMRNPQPSYTMGGFWFYDNRASNIKTIIEQQLGPA